MLPTVTKAFFLALAIALTGCATQKGSPEMALQIYNAKQSDEFIKTAVLGRIVSVRVGARGSQDTGLELGAHSGNSVIKGLAGVSIAASLVDGARTVFWITYKAKEEDAPKTFYSNMIPSRPDLFTEGTLFRYIKTKDGYEHVRRFDTEEEFNKFYE